MSLDDVASMSREAMIGAIASHVMWTLWLFPIARRNVQITTHRDGEIWVSNIYFDGLPLADQRTLPQKEEEDGITTAGLLKHFLESCTYEHIRMR